MTTTPNNLLTPREHDVARLIARDLTNGEIANLLHLKMPTVVGFVQQVMVKLHARSRLGVAVKVIQLGLVDLAELDDPIPQGLRSLTRREDEVLAMLEQGHTTWEVVDKLKTTRRRVYGIEQDIRMKWNVNSRKEILALAPAYRLQEDKGAARD